MTDMDALRATVEQVLDVLALRLEVSRGGYVGGGQPHPVIPTDPTVLDEFVKSLHVRLLTASATGDPEEREPHRRCNLLAECPCWVAGAHAERFASDRLCPTCGSSLVPGTGTSKGSLVCAHGHYSEQGIAALSRQSEGLREALTVIAIARGRVDAGLAGRGDRMVWQRLAEDLDRLAALAAAAPSQEGPDGE